MKLFITSLYNWIVTKEAYLQEDVQSLTKEEKNAFEKIVYSHEIQPAFVPINEKRQNSLVEVFMKEVEAIEDEKNLIKRRNL